MGSLPGGQGTLTVPRHVGSQHTNSGDRSCKAMARQPLTGASIGAVAPGGVWMKAVLLIEQDALRALKHKIFLSVHDLGRELAVVETNGAGPQGAAQGRKLR